MTPRAYQTAQRLAIDPGATPAERDTAQRRVQEYEARHGKPAPGGPLGSWLHNEAAGAHDMRDLCATCGKDWALHWIAHTLDNVPPSKLPCTRFVPKMKPPRRPPRDGVGPVPWWTLDVRRTSGRRLGLTYEFRCGLRHLREQTEQPRERGPWTLYLYSPRTAEHVERGEVDWSWFPSLQEEGRTGNPWRPPEDMRAAMKRTKS